MLDPHSNKKIVIGITLVTAISAIAFGVAEVPFVNSLSLSPLIVGVVLGMVYANTVRSRIPHGCVAGVLFCSKRLLRLAIIFYGFRLTIQSVMDVGMAAILTDIFIIVSTIAIGMVVGKILKMDSDLALLTSTGSAICGAAAVLGAEPVVKAPAHMTAVAVSTVVIFGTLAMFLYPVMYRTGILELTPEQWGIYTGATVHEVAHVVGAGNGMGETVSGTAIVVKMIRVLFLAPVLLIMAFVMVQVRKNRTREAGKTKLSLSEITIPWFAFGFIGIILFNSLNLIPAQAVDYINQIDTFLLTMAMTALGMETNFSKFKQAGAKPFILAFVLFVWLVVGGYFVVKYLSQLLM